MAKTVPTSYTPPSYREVLAGAGVDVADWAAEIEGLHHLWSRAGARVPLYLGAQTPFETTEASSFTQTDEATTAPVDLSVQTGVLRLSRPVVLSSALKHRLVLRCYGQDIDVRATVFAPDGNTTLGTLTAACGATWEWATATLDLTDAQASEGGSASNPYRVLGVSLEAQTTDVTGFLWQALIHDVIATAAMLPDGS